MNRQGNEVGREEEGEGLPGVEVIAGHTAVLGGIQLSDIHNHTLSLALT